MSKLLRSLVMFLIVLTCSLSASAQTVHPVADAQQDCLLGGTRNGKWLDADAIAPLLKGGERYRLYTLSKAGEMVVGSGATKADTPCNGAQQIEFSPKPTKGIAVGGNWNAQPRVPQKMGTNVPLYRQAVASILRRHGFTNPKINLTQVLRVDLEGDGAEEVIISANYLAEGLSVNGGPMAVHAQPGDYSLVILRKIVRGKARDIILTEGYYPRRTAEGWLPEQNEVAAVLDLNGDGRMEIIIHGGYYEGWWSTVFRLNGGRAKNVFGCGCGA